MSDLPTKFPTGADRTKLYKRVDRPSASGIAFSLCRAVLCPVDLPNDCGGERALWRPAAAVWALGRWRLDRRISSRGPIPTLVSLPPLLGALFRARGLSGRREMCKLSVARICRGRSYLAEREARPSTLPSANLRREPMWWALAACPAHNPARSSHALDQNAQLSLR